MRNVCGLACNDTYLHWCVNDSDTESKFNLQVEFSVSSASLLLGRPVSTFPPFVTS